MAMSRATDGRKGNNPGSPISRHGDGDGQHFGQRNSPIAEGGLVEPREETFARKPDER